MRSTIARLTGRPPSRFFLFHAYCEPRFDPLDNPTIPTAFSKPAQPAEPDPPNFYTRAAVPINRWRSKNCDDGHAGTKDPSCGKALGSRDERSGGGTRAGQEGKTAFSHSGFISARAGCLADLRSVGVSERQATDRSEPGIQLGDEIAEERQIDHGNPGR